MHSPATYAPELKNIVLASNQLAVVAGHMCSTQSPPTRAHTASQLSPVPASPTNHSGVSLGDVEGTSVGLSLGPALGLVVGLADGDTDGAAVGVAVSRAPLHGQIRRAVARCAASGDAGGAAPQHSRS